MKKVFEKIFSRSEPKAKVATQEKKKQALKNVGERYGRALTRLSDT